MKQPRVAFVVQRFGADIAGGSEQHCRLVAEHLSRYCSCEVITTCAKDYVTWENEFPPGETTISGVKVHRFPVDSPRDMERFNRLSATVFSGAGDVGAEVEWMRAQGPYSSALLSYLEESKDKYDVFIFFTYLYCTTYFGLPLVSDRAILVPTAHDEPPIYLSIFDKLFQAPRRFLFNTEEEKDFLMKRFCLPDETGEIVALGIEDECSGTDDDPNTLEALVGDAPYILYLGRIDESKGCKVLMDWFVRFTADPRCGALRLVAAGKAVMPIPPNERIITPGYVSEATKRTLIRNSLFLIVPSPYESLSMSALEAWLHRKPVLVNGDCLVLAGQCRRSNGGLWYRNYEEFAECASTLIAETQMREQLGYSGWQFVNREYRWQRVEAAYLQSISRVMAATSASSKVLVEHA